MNLRADTYICLAFSPNSNTMYVQFIRNLSWLFLHVDDVNYSQIGLSEKKNQSFWPRWSTIFTDRYFICPATTVTHVLQINRFHSTRSKIGDFCFWNTLYEWFSCGWLKSSYTKWRPAKCYDRVLLEKSRISFSFFHCTAGTFLFHFLRFTCCAYAALFNCTFFYLMNIYRNTGMKKTQATKA